MKFMRDRFGRKIEYIRVSVTDRCNLRCIYCMPPEGVLSVPHREILTFDEIERVCSITAQLGISRVKLTGGEPLVRRGLPFLLGRLKRISGVEQVTLTTNGTLLKEQIRDLTANGLDAVNISLDTLDAERYSQVTRGGSLDQVLEGLNAALECRELPVKINCVPLKEGTDEDLIRTAELARKHPVDVRFIELMPIGPGRESAGRSSGDIKELLEERFGKSEPYKAALGNGPAEYVIYPGFRGRIGFIGALSHKFCSTCNRLRLTSEGMLKPCLQYGTATNIKALLRGGASDEKIREAVIQTVLSKPACHHFSEENNNEDENGQKENREMFRIGG